MFVRDLDAGWMDHIGLDPTRPQPASKPEAVAASLECRDNPIDCATRFGRFGLPPAQQRQQRLRVGAQFLQRLPAEARARHR